MNKLQEIKEQYEWGIATSHAYFNLSHSDIEWLIEQAEMAEKYEQIIKSIQQYATNEKETPNCLDSIHDYIKTSMFEIDNTNK